MSLPKPLLSNDGIEYIGDHLAGHIWDTWSKDPIKAAVLRAILSCNIGLSRTFFGQDMSLALNQKVGSLHSFSLEVEEAHY